MKSFKNLILITVFSALIFIGCSENQNPVVNSYGYQRTEINQLAAVKPNLNLLWKHDGLSISASGEYSVYAETSFEIGDDANYNLLISYDGWTTPDTSCYISTVVISLDGNNIHMDIGELYINGHHEFNLENLSGENLRFLITLWHDEIECISNAKLEISNLKVYSY